MDTVALEWARQRLIWRISLTPIHVLGILASIYRISRRCKTRQSGLDDYAATLALMLDLIFFPTLWLRNGDDTQKVGLSTTVANGGLLGDDLPADIESRIAQVVIGWVVQVVYLLLTWTTKASLALSISRLIPKIYCTHKAGIVVACLSALISLGLVIQTCIFCTTVDKTWTLVPPYRCTVTEAAGIVRGCTEVIVDILLILIPFCAFFMPIPRFSFGPSPAPNRSSATASDLPNNNHPPLPARLRLGLPPVTRRLIQFCFLASLLTTSTAIVLVVVLFKIQNSSSLEIQSRIGYISFVLSHLTASVSLLVCNLLIVITSIYRVLRAPPQLVEIGKSPIIPSLSTQENSESEPRCNNASGTGRRERATAEGDVSENGGSGGNDTSSYPRTAASSTGIRIELTLAEIYESEHSFV